MPERSRNSSACGRVGDDPPQALAQELARTSARARRTTRTSCGDRARCSSRRRSRVTSSRNERSDSSASTTSHSPVPNAAFVGGWPVRGRSRGEPQLAADHERRIPADRHAARASTIDEVVVLPWVPAIAIVRRSRLSSPSSAPRWISRRPRSRAGDALGVVHADRGRDDELDAVAVRHVRRVMADGRRRSRGRVRARSTASPPGRTHSTTGAQLIGDQRESAHARAADADEMQAPPAPVGHRALTAGDAPAGMPAPRRRPPVRRRGGRARLMRSPSPPAATGRRAARRRPRRGARR